MSPITIGHHGVERKGRQNARRKSAFRYVYVSLAKTFQVHRMLELRDGSQWLPQTWDKIMTFLESRGKITLSPYIRKLVQDKARQGSIEADSVIRAIAYCDKLVRRREKQESGYCLETSQSDP